MKTQNNINGFTLVELLIAMALSGVVMAAISTVFMAQQSSYYAQDQTAKMQQNLRGGMNLFTREVRLAGYDLTGTAGASITTATGDTLRFTLDLDEDGDVDDAGEDIQYDRYQNNDGVWCLGRSVQGAARQAVAENIEMLEFFYTMDDGDTTLTPGNLDNIRSVQISILAQAKETDPKFVSDPKYTTASDANWDLGEDNYRRRFLITRIQFRNMGLE